MHWIASYSKNTADKVHANYILEGSIEFAIGKSASDARILECGNH